MKPDYRLPDWIVLTIGLIISFVFEPTIIVAPIAMVISFIIISSDTLTKPFNKKDAIFTFIALNITAIAYVVLLGYSFFTVPLWKLIIIGLLADSIVLGVGWLATAGYVTGFALGFVIDLITAVALFYGIWWYVGGVEGAILACLAGIITMLPLPIPLVTVSFIFFYTFIHYFINAII